MHYADDYLSYFTQGSTQYDALGHVLHDDQIWNGYDAKTTIGGLAKASVMAIADRGVVGRGIRLDIARWRGKDVLAKGETFTHEDLMACATAHGAKIEPRDILIVRTGWIANEVSTDPVSGVALPLHNALMRNLGITLTEIAWLEDLAADCAEDRQYTFLYTAAPLKIVFGTGAPVNPVVIK